ncbi:hypothetical protein AAC387_Pa01g1814 [Persea americana]
MSPFDLLFKKKRHPLLGRRQGEQGWLEDGARLLKEVISSCDGRGCYPIRMFSAKEIEQAIGQRFHEEAFFVEYEGNHEGRQIIIKVYKRKRELVFNEIATVTQIKHANVAKLLGCCFEMEPSILIYEYVPFILRDLLWEGNPSSSLISWEHRLRIAIEIAYAITYLHIGTSRPIVHRGIKSSNILLDEHCKPKLCDFSFSITIPFGETHVETDVVGTIGHLAPEYGTRGIVSDKSDVYCYGVVLIELLSGKKLATLLIEGDLDFIYEEITDKEKILKLILGNGLSMNVNQVKQAMACMELAVRCKTNNRDERPAMKEVAQQLEQIERGELTLSSSLLRVQQLATVGSSEGVSQIRTQYESESISSEEVSPP